MTKKELQEKLNDPDLPDDAIICGQLNGQLYEMTYIEYHVDIHYIDKDDNKQQGNVIEI